MADLTDILTGTDNGNEYDGIDMLSGDQITDTSSTYGRPIPNNSDPDFGF